MVSIAHRKDCAGAQVDAAAVASMAIKRCLEVRLVPTHDGIAATPLDRTSPYAFA